MTHKGLKLGLAGVTLAGAVTYLAVRGVQGGWQYDVGVDQYMAQSELKGKRARVAGTVSDEGFAVRKGNLGADFYVLGQSKKLRVSYRGTIPDQFRVGCAIVVEGKEDAMGVFQGDVLLTKCASKYEEMAKPVVTGSQTASKGGANGGETGGQR